MVFTVKPKNGYESNYIHSPESGTWVADKTSPWWITWCNETNVCPVESLATTMQNFSLEFTNGDGLWYTSSPIMRIGKGWVQTHSGSFYAIS